MSNHETHVDGQAHHSQLRMIRVAEGLSQAELAKLSGISAATISDIENGKKSPRDLTKHRLINGLNTNPKKIREGNYVVEDAFPHDVQIDVNNQ